MAEGTTLKRRGLMAAAAAMVAGIAARQASQPVAAHDPDDVALGNGLFDTTKNVSTAATTITASGDAGAAFRGRGTGGTRGVEAISDSGTALIASTGSGVNSPDSRAVIVTQSDAGPRAIGVDVTNDNSPNGFAFNGRVHGSGGIAVQGQCDTAFGVGVKGISSSYYGVQGQTDNGVAVLGDVLAGGSGTSNIGVIGRVGVAAANAQNNTTAVYGQNAATGTGGYGVRGDSNRGTGVYGSTVSGLYGVVGSSGTAQGSAGLLGIANGPNAIGFGTVTAGGATFAGYFNGTTVVNGAFAVTGSKSAAVKDAAGEYRLMYSVESPEAWFEDFGTGTLVGGKAEIKIDPQFAQHIHTDAYHVFLTAYGNTNGLHVTSRSGQGFTVEEHNGGKNNLTFSWRVVAKRNDIGGERLAKFTMPPALVAPDVPSAPPAPVPTSRPSGASASDASTPAPLPAAAPTAAPSVQSAPAGQPAPLPPSR